MPVDTDPDSSRAATNRLLGELHAGRWRPWAWRRFLSAAVIRSASQAAAHRQALVEASPLHGLFIVLAGRRTDPPARWRWIATSWALSALHLGLLESRPALGVANTLTLARANLPATGAGLGRWLGVAALTTDFVDGKFARRTSTQSFRHGRMLDPPRPELIRPAAALQIMLAARCLRRPPDYNNSLTRSHKRSTGRARCHLRTRTRHPLRRTCASRPERSESRGKAR